MLHAPATLLVLLLASSASAVLIDSGDGSGNTSAPSPDPGWIHLGTQGSNTVVYLGDACVLTANHVGEGPVTLDGFVYPEVPGSGVQIPNPDGMSFADLLVFAIDPYPVMTPLPIAESAPPVGEPVIMIGHGRNRGPVTSWDANGPPPPGPIFGYDWASGRTMRWGTNQVDGYPVDPVLDTWSFLTIFDAGGSSDEAQAANGDSGGAIFVEDGGDWELAGISFAIGQYAGQPSDVSLYGQVTYAADLSVYRDEIQDIVCLPEPHGALGLGVLLLAVLRRRRPTRGAFAAG